MMWTLVASLAVLAGTSAQSLLREHPVCYGSQ